MELIQVRSAVGWCGAGGNYMGDDSVGSDEEVPFLLTNENAGSRPIRWRRWGFSGSQARNTKPFGFTTFTPSGTVEPKCNFAS